MKKQHWDGSNRVECEMCQNAARNTDVNYGHGIGVPQCYDELAELTAIVDYGYELSDPMKLCSRCMANLKKSCRKSGYKVKSIEL